MIRTVRRLRSSASLGSYSPEAADFFLRSGLTNPTDRVNYGTMIDALVTADVLVELVELGILAAPTEPVARTNIKPGISTVLPVNSPVFTAYRGYQGNGSASHLRARGPNNNGIVLPATGVGASLGAWSLTSRAPDASASVGCEYFGARFYILPNFSGGNTMAYVFTTQNSPAVTNAVGSRALVVATRPDSSTSEVYINGAFVSSFASSDAGGGTPPGALFGIGGLIVNGTTFNFSTDQYAMYFYGRHLTAAKQAALYSAVQTYLTAVGALP